MSVYQKTVSHAPASLDKNNNTVEDDDWETDADYVNDIPEKDTRWGSKIIVKDNDANKPMDEIRNNAFQKHDDIVQKEYEDKKILYGGERAAKSQKD
ncbi:hypothetical protein DICPUDRAFT_93002 [Dictyostelium purpureum]|uniref:Uncharacterized protein n=1 Tax=Dictyostelium purpureum TaxID=5786 RepID=F1A0K7_DICPU|nr:uncharacterized protein DICPUDRAFT_93002 [Dictyostelium purpureum]EGC30276.1 hypothetical protein DICPUDRAFT_93002 [Dictyostelium purpureum]|eukprot:XP_003293203.1 hypothetical protein DICPUDRAFT_93002 [Dictyostelium purpureum]